MIIIKLQGGLGNQLFLYGLYKNLVRLGHEVKMDIESGFEGDKLRTPCLQSLGLEYTIATEDEVIEIRDSYMDLCSRIRRKIFGRRTFDYYEPSDGNYDPKVLEMNKAYLNGYFQSEKYFGDEGAIKDLKDDILKNKDIILSSTQQIRKLSERMNLEESVSLHIRRGDYLTPGIRETYGGICTDEYYQKAIDKIKEKYPKASFFIFSNDLEWCREKFGKDENITFVDISLVDELKDAVTVVDDKGKASENITIGNYKDAAEMFLMASCKHHILANSSFSWWGAWLSDYDGMTIAPSKWLNNKNMTDIYTDRMLKI